MIGGGGVRTPLVIHGLAQSQRELGIAELTVYDVDPGRTRIIAEIGREIVRRHGADFVIRVAPEIEPAVDGADFVLSSIRVGGMSARARDERITIAHELAGQETTGPGGAAMALRTVPISLVHARVVERLAPTAWFINFTNPAGLMTQALTQDSRLRVVGICDTPIELFHRIATAMGCDLSEMTFDYAGLNHLGWVHRVCHRGKDVTEQLLNDPEKLKQIYPGGLFDPVLIRTLGLLPTEYLFFYYRQRVALSNQRRAGSSRGGELERMNVDLFQRLGAVPAAEGLDIYRDYLQRRNASYMKLEAEAGSAFSTEKQQEDPFDAATGYHRIALDVMSALVSEHARTVVVNVPNQGTIPDLEDDDVVEAPCSISRQGIVPQPGGPLSEPVRGLVLAVKAYERTTIRAAKEGSLDLAKLALLEYPIVGQWDLACEVLEELVKGDSEFLGYLS